VPANPKTMTKSTRFKLFSYLVKEKAHSDPVRFGYAISWIGLQP